MDWPAAPQTDCGRPAHPGSGHKRPGQSRCLQGLWPGAEPPRCSAHMSLPPHLPKEMDPMRTMLGGRGRCTLRDQLRILAQKDDEGAAPPTPPRQTWTWGAAWLSDIRTELVPFPPGQMDWLLPHQGQLSVLALRPPPRPTPEGPDVAPPPPDVGRDRYRAGTKDRGVHFQTLSGLRGFDLPWGTRQWAHPRVLLAVPWSSVQPSITSGCQEDTGEESGWAGPNLALQSAPPHSPGPSPQQPMPLSLSISPEPL